MKDAYSFHTSEEDALREYKKCTTPTRASSPLRSAFRAVELTPAHRRSQSHEFQVLTETAKTPSCLRQVRLRANVEEASALGCCSAAAATPAPAVEKVATPGKRTIEEVSTFLAANRRTWSRRSSTWPTESRGRAGARDRSANDVKVKRVLGCTELVLAADKAVEEITAAPVGFAGPVGLRIPIYCDHEVCVLPSLCVRERRGPAPAQRGSKRDFSPPNVATSGRRLSRRLPALRRRHFIGYRGIEVGQVFSSHQVLGAHEVQLPRHRRQGEAMSWAAMASA